MFVRQDDYELHLDETSAHRLRVVCRYDKGLEDFAVIYVFIGRDGVPKDLVTYDLAHGFAHRDLRFLSEFDKRRKKALESRTTSEQFQEALADATRNWRHFYLQYLENNELMKP